MDWQEAWWELTLAPNGVKYAHATVFFVRPNETLALDDLSGPSAGINCLLLLRNAL